MQIIQTCLPLTQPRTAHKPHPPSPTLLARQELRINFVKGVVNVEIFSVLQFAGGFDAESMKAFKELRSHTKTGEENKLEAWVRTSHLFCNVPLFYKSSLLSSVHWSLLSHTKNIYISSCSMGIAELIIGLYLWSSTMRKMRSVNCTIYLSRGSTLHSTSKGSNGCIGFEYVQTAYSFTISCTPTG